MITVFGLPENATKQEILEKATFAFINGDIYFQGNKVNSESAKTNPNNISLFILSNLPSIVQISSMEDEALVAFSLNNLDEFLALTLCANKNKVFNHLLNKKGFPSEKKFRKLFDKLKNQDFNVARIFADDTLDGEVKVQKACDWLLT